MTNQDNIDNKPEVMTNITQILNAVQKQKTTYESNYWVPSLGRDVRFSEINTSQQKRLIKSIVDSPVYNTEYIQTFRDILRENCVEEEVNIDNLTVIDKLLIALGLRISSIGGRIDLDVKPDAEKPSQTVSVDLIKLHEVAKTTLSSIKPVMFENDLFVIECSVPTVGTEYRLEREFRLNNENIEIESNKALRDTIGEAFIDEIVKYISDVSVKTEEAVTPVSWDKFNFKDRITVVESFNTALLKDIVGYINKVKEESNKIEVVKFQFDGKEYDRRLTIDGSFFMISSS